MIPGIDINGWELILLLVLTVVILGPEKMPEYAARLAQFVKRARAYAEGAKGQLREQMGPEFDDIDWKSYDPRQYDPRRIVREALAEDTAADEDPFGHDEPPALPGTPYGNQRHDPTHTPWDVDAT